MRHHTTAPAVLALLLAGCPGSHPIAPDGASADAGALPDGALRDGALPDGAPDDGGLPDGALPATCILGTAAPCVCPGGASGYRYCEPADHWGACECAVPALDAGTYPDGGPRDPSEACTGDPEWCDGLDNDCDGVVDNGHPCPDSTVQNTLPYDGAVWLRAREEGAGSACVGAGVQRVWPTFAADPFELPCGAYPLFRPTDGALFYSYGSRGLFRAVRAGGDLEVPTPPCYATAYLVGFDAADRVVYGCDLSLRAGNGEIVGTEPAGGQWSRGARLSSGRMVMWDRTRPNTFFLMNEDAVELSSLDLRSWVGVWHPNSEMTSQGDSVFVSFDRTYRGGTRQEVVIFRVDGATAEWRTVRRVPVNPAAGGASSLPLPDGRLLRYDGHRLVEHPPDGPPRMLLGHGVPDHVAYSTWSGMITGPLEAAP